MFEDLSVVIPFRPVSEERKRIFDWVYGRTKSILPGAEIIVSSDSRNTQDYFNKSMAINEGVLCATRPIISMLDADLIIDSFTFGMGLEALKTSPLAVLMSHVRYLSKEVSDQILELDPVQSISSLGTAEPRVVAQAASSVGGAIVFYRDKFVKMGGCDERLVGWGYEDNVFHTVYSALFGKPHRIMGHIYHIHHSHSPNPSDYSEDNYFQNEYRLILKNNPVANNKKIWEEYSSVKDSAPDLLNYIRKNCISPFPVSI